jgi:sugar lactone lactonase YvrE
LRISVSFVAVLISAAAFAQQPRIDVVSPSRGPIAGGTVVTINGSNLDGTSVSLDGTSLTTDSQSATRVVVTMPAHDNGFVVLTLRNGSGAAQAEYLYVPPKLSEIPAGYITTVAGIGAYTRLYGPAINSNVNAGSLALDAAGKLYIADGHNARVFRVNLDGTIEPFAGTGNNSGVSGNGGPALDADLFPPRAVTFDGRGNLYISGDRCELRRVDANGIITTIAGNGTCGFSGDNGPSVNARIASPTWMAADRDDFFFIDFTYVVTPESGGPRDSVRIRRIHLDDGILSTVAGNGTIGFSGDGGPAVNASFNFGPRSVDAGSLALDPQGNIYVVDAGNGRIRRIDRATGIINTFHVVAEGEATWLTFDAIGNAYYAAANQIVKLNANGDKVTSYGNNTRAFSPDGTPIGSGSISPSSIVVEHSGNVIYSSLGINRIRRLNFATGLLETVAGIGPSILGENGPALETVAGAGVEGSGLIFDRNGDLLLGDTGSGRLRRLMSDGTLKTIAGTGSFIGSLTDGLPATQASVYPVGLAVDSRGGIDVTNRSDVVRIDAGGLLFHTTTRDVSRCVLEGDGGPSLSATVCQPWDVLRDSNDNLLIADTNNNRIRRVDAKTSIITTIAGNGGPLSGYERYGFGTDCGDGGQAFDACINTPYGLARDDAGNLFVATLHHIRRIDDHGVISTLADRNGVTKIAYSRGFLYAGLTRFDTRNGAVTAIAGGGTGALIGDGGPARQARAGSGGQGTGIAIDAEGNYYFVDTANRRIRAIRYGTLLAPKDATLELSVTGGGIRARVLDGSQQPAPSVRVDFAVPQSGPSCTLSAPFAITDPNGVATVTCVPNCIGGTYEVTVTPLTSGSRSVPMTNAAGPCRRRAVRHES